MKFGRAFALKALWDAVRGARSMHGHSVSTQLRALPRLVVATLSGRYDGMDRSRVLLMALAALYVVSPVDLVPEAVLLLAGVADDAMVLAWLAGTVLSETDAFLAWEGQRGQAPSDAGARAQEKVVPGQVV